MGTNIAATSTSRKLRNAGIAAALLVGAIAGTTAPKAAEASGSSGIRLLGSSSMGGSSSGSSRTDYPLRASGGEDEGAEIPQLHTYSRKPIYKKGPQIPNPSSTTVTSADSSYRGFAGLNIIDHLHADDGNQGGLEPPDQALAVGNGYVLEAVNTTMVVYDKSGNVVSGPTSLNQFFTHDHMYDQSTGTWGAFLSDPSAYYDADAGRWFMSILQADFGTGQTSVMIAVSKTASPTGDWWIYALDTTDIGLPDYPMIGTDANGVFITVNGFAFPTATSGYVFEGAFIYGVQKSALMSGSSAPKIQKVGSLLADLGATLQPATVPPGSAFATYGGGTEYFMSTLDWDGTLDNEILVWALSNTSSLNGTPDLRLSRKSVGTQDYGFPPPAEQRSGPTPLRSLVESGAFTDGVPFPEDLAHLSSNDDRMHQVVYADGKLWGAANSIVKSSKQQARTGVAYFVVEPSWSRGSLQASVVKQGFVSVQNNSCIMPTLGVTKDGKGAITFTLVGPDHFPTVAYARIDAKNGAGKVQIAATGGVPEDGFSGYELFSGGDVARWGDYSECAVDDATGDVWFAGELTINDPNRPWFANWGTHIGHVKP